MCELRLLIGKCSPIVIATRDDCANIGWGHRWDDIPLLLYPEPIIKMVLARRLQLGKGHQPATTHAGRMATTTNNITIPVTTAI